MGTKGLIIGPSEVFDIADAAIYRCGDQHKARRIQARCAVIGIRVLEHGTIESYRSGPGFF